MSLFKHFSRLYAPVSNCTINTTYNHPIRNQEIIIKCPRVFGIVLSNKFHSSGRSCELMEFFDDKENWNKEEVKVGRSWRLDELRIKSNSDLHKLWFVLLKEKNMLLTMEHEYKERMKLMPNPERIHKINESMKNLETVVKERNRAYYQLETGETGEREIVNDYNSFGLPYQRKLKEHFVERHFNQMHKLRGINRHRMVYDPDVISFLKLYKEKMRKAENWRNKRLHNYVCGLYRRFSNIEDEAVKAEFPDVDLEAVKKDKKARGPRVNKY